jgi:DNA-binding MarR family transcriptional regulator
MGSESAVGGLDPLSEAEEAFFRAFGRALVTVPRALDADLMREQGMSASEYFTLMHLSEVPDRSLRMGDLAAAAALSLSGMTRIVQRLEAQGFVRREKSVCDGRSWIATLTDTGYERLTQAWPSHLASVRRHVMDHLRGADLEGFTVALQKFAANTRAQAEECAAPAAAI